MYSTRSVSLAVLAPIRHPIRFLVEHESVLAPVCALTLLLHPTPLSWPALVLGLLPSGIRLSAIGRPWRPTPFDPGLALFGLGALVGQSVSLDPADGAVRLFGLAAGLVLFGWVRERAAAPESSGRPAVAALGVVAVGGLLMLHVAQPFLLFNRVPPLGWLATVIEPLGLYRVLVADEFALQRFRLYASGAGAVAATGLAMAVGLGLTAVNRRWRGIAVLAGLWFGAVLLASDNRGSMLAAALAVGGLLVWWRPRLLLLAVLLVFGTLDLIALGVVQRGLSLRTLLERTDFWQKGLELAAETPFTGVGLGVTSVQAVYRTAFQPAYPPFNHAHSIFVQALLEQGVLGLVGLGLLCLAVIRLGPARRDWANPHRRSVSFVALGGVLALLAAGLTEIVALTTVGGALLFGLLGLLAAAHDADSKADWAEQVEGSGGPGWTAEAITRTLQSTRPTRLQTIATVLAVAGLVAFLFGRQLAALPFVNLGTSALYRSTLERGLDRGDRAQSLASAVRALRLAVTVDPSNVAAFRNLALAEAVSGQSEQAHQHADEARARVASGDRDAVFGVGRAYVAAGAWNEAIAAWTEIGAGPQLLDLGRQLVQGPDWQTGNAALIAAAQLGAPGRSAADAITRAALARGLPTDAVVEELRPLLEAGGQESGMVRYFAWLQAAHVYRQAGQTERAEDALAQAEQPGLDPQIELERALIRVAEGRLQGAEAALTWIVAHTADDQVPMGLPDGDDPRYWLAVVQLRLGKPEQALATARDGLANLPADQESLKAPYQGVLGESLLALGRPSEALAAFRAGLRLTPADPALIDGLARARVALPK